MLGLYGRPLFDQEVEAWKYGPVVPDIYHGLKDYRRRPVDTVIPGVADGEWDIYEQNILDQVAEKMGDMSGEDLSHATHWPDSPWFDVRVEDGLGAVIPDELIEDHFARQAARHERK